MKSITSRAPYFEAAANRHEVCYADTEGTEWSYNAIADECGGNEHLARAVYAKLPHEWGGPSPSDTLSQMPKETIAGMELAQVVSSLGAIDPQGHAVVLLGIPKEGGVTICKALLFESPALSISILVPEEVPDPETAAARLLKRDFPQSRPVVRAEAGKIAFDSAERLPSSDEAIAAYGQSYENDLWWHRSAEEAVEAVGLALYHAQARQIGEYFADSDPRALFRAQSQAAWLAARGGEVWRERSLDPLAAQRAIAKAARASNDPNGLLNIPISQCRPQFFEGKEEVRIAIPDDRIFGHLGEGACLVGGRRQVNPFGSGIQISGMWSIRIPGAFGLSEPISAGAVQIAFEAAGMQRPKAEEEPEGEEVPPVVAGREAASKVRLLAQGASGTKHKSRRVGS